jgi:hypothetical protein
MSSQGAGVAHVSSVHCAKHSQCVPLYAPFNEHRGSPMHWRETTPTRIRRIISDGRALRCGRTKIQTKHLRCSSHPAREGTNQSTFGTKSSPRQKRARARYHTACSSLRSKPPGCRRKRDRGWRHRLRQRRRRNSYRRRVRRTSCQRRPYR